MKVIFAVLALAAIVNAESKPDKKVVVSHGASYSEPHTTGYSKTSSVVLPATVHKTVKTYSGHNNLGHHGGVYGSHGVGHHGGVYGSHGLGGLYGSEHRYGSPVHGSVSYSSHRPAYGYTSQSYVAPLSYGYGSVGGGLYGGHSGLGLGGIYGGNNIGYGSHNIGYGSHNLGYGSHNIGYGSHNLGYGSHNIGYGGHNSLGGYGSHHGLGGGHGRVTYSTGGYGSHGLSHGLGHGLGHGLSHGLGHGLSHGYNTPVRGYKQVTYERAGHGYNTPHVSYNSHHGGDHYDDDDDKYHG